ncbi:MAG: hypothetical protein Q4Q31_10225, partial [Bacillota bacterium]|nr:hypothetical protein [Bacillota bacterium]
MISQNVYVRFDTFNTRDEVLDFVYDEKELNSNINNWKNDLDKYIVKPQIQHTSQPQIILTI